MSVNYNSQWKTKDGRVLYIFEFTDEHLANLIPFLERKLKAGVGRHVCSYWDIKDTGICVDCLLSQDDEAEIEGWIELAKMEQKRRAADQARRAQ